MSDRFWRDDWEHVMLGRYEDLTTTGLMIAYAGSGVGMPIDGDRLAIESNPVRYAQRSTTGTP